MRLVFAFVLTALASSLVCAVARAQPTSEPDTLPGDCPASPQATAEQRRLAARLFDEGERASTALRVGPAAHAFACSYAIVATAQAAYNAGVAYEGADDARRASFWFRRYLALEPSAVDRSTVEARAQALDARVAEDETRAAAARAAREEATRRDAARIEAEAEARAAAAARAREQREAEGTQPASGFGTIGLVGVVAAGTGAAAVITGFVLYGVSGGVHDDFVTGGRVDASLASEGETLDVAASSLWVGGAVLLVAGAGLVLFELLGVGTERAPQSGRMAPYLAPRGTAGADLGLAGTF